MDNCEENSRDELLNKVMQNKFYVNELTLYLDTHPDDKKALELHNEYVEKLKETVKVYERKYEPLTIETIMDSWEWAQDLWPWERGFNNNVEL